MESRVRLIRAVVAAVAAGTCCEAARADDGPPPGVEVAEVMAAGNGCPAGSVATELSPDRQALTLTFSSMVAAAGPGQPLTGRRSQCSVLVRLTVLPGWTYTVANTGHSGSASLDAQVPALLRTSYFFQGAFPAHAGETILSHPREGSFATAETLDPAGALWAPCDTPRAMTVSTEARVNVTQNPVGAGQVRVQTVRLGLRWRSCQ